VKTVPALTTNVAEVAPCATVTLVGIVSPAGELDKLTTAPPEGAALLNVTVPVAEPPLVSALGATATLDKAAGGGFTVTLAVLVTPRYAAVTVIEVAVDTVPALTAKVAELAPCATVTLVGIVSPAGELDKLTTTPPEGAALLKVTVPVADPPLAITPGATAMLDNAAPGGFTITPAEWFTPR
jgi:hypothetical protein